ncbi:hypothetical protein GY12_16785 [Micrococcus luteus]|nr:hypothetical protein GY12_16785 [Micrococcus luteus]
MAREVVTERKASVVTVEAGRTGPARAACSGGGDRRPLGLVDRGVQGRDAGHQLRMTRRPAEGDNARPSRGRA